MIFRRDAILESGARFNSELKQFTDIFLPLVIALKNGAIFIPETMASWRYRDGYAETNFRDVAATHLSLRKMIELTNTPEFCHLFPDKFIVKYEQQLNYYLENRKLQALENFMKKFIKEYDESRNKNSSKESLFLLAATIFFKCQYWMFKVDNFCKLVNWNFFWAFSYLWGRRRNSSHYKINDPLTIGTLKR
jgi:hypothetical protein